MKLRIESETTNAEQYLGRIRDNYLRKAVRRSIKETATTVKTHLSRGVAKTRELKMNIGDIKRRVFMRDNLRGDVPVNAMQATIEVDPNKISLHRFKGVRSRTVTRNVKGKGWQGRPWKYTRKRKFTQVTATILGKRYVTGGFYRTVGAMMAGNVSIGGNNILFKRKGEKRRPLRKLWGTSMADIVRKTTLENEVRNEARTRLVSVLQRNINFYISKR